MPKQNIINTNFTSGEVSPLVRGRVDAQRYSNGLETCHNFIVRPQGPLVRRSGTKYLGKTKYPDKKSILVPFEYSDTKGYVLEVGLGYMHVWQNDGKLFESNTLAYTGSFDITSNGGLARIGQIGGTPPAWGALGYGTVDLKAIQSTVGGLRDKVRVTTVTMGHGLRTGDIIFLQVESPGGSTVARSGEFVITRVTDYSFDCNNSSSFAAWILANAWDDVTFFSLGVSAGDRIYFQNDATNQRLLQNKYATIHTVDGPYKFTTNTPYVSGDKVNAECHLRPIEILTNYGYMPAKYITNLAASGTEIAVTLAGHGYQTGDTVEVLRTESAADGTWVITKTTDDAFTLNGSIFSTGGGTVGYARKYIGPTQLDELRFVQSADVVYIIHPDHPVHKLTRLDNDGDKDDWLYAKIDFKDGPYLNVNSLAPRVNETTPAEGSYFKDVYLQLENYSHFATATVGPKGTVSATLSSDGAGPVYFKFTTINPHGLQAGDYVIVSGSDYAPLNGNRTVAAPITDTTFVIQVAYNAAGTVANYRVALKSTDSNKYIEYREGDQWRLAKIGSVSNYATTASVTIIDNVLLNIDETTKFSTRDTYDKSLKLGKSKYDAGQQNTSPAIPGAGTRRRGDPNNYLYAASAAATQIDASYANTFGQADVGKYVRVLVGTANAGVPQWNKIKNLGSSVSTASGKTAICETAVDWASCYNTADWVISNETRQAQITAFNPSGTFAAFSRSDVGRHIRLGYGGRWTWGVIGGYTSSSVVLIKLYEDMPRDPMNAANIAGAIVCSSQPLTSNAGCNISRCTTWRLGAWSGTTGYPSCGVFHEQRLWFGRTDTEPQTIWGSISGDFENFSPTELDSAVLEDNAINFTIASTKVNPIKWMVSGPTITVGTVGGEWQVKSSSASSEPITPLNIVVVPHTGHGSSSVVQPLKVGGSVLFADRPGKKIRELVYDFSVDSLIANDITYLSEHLLRNGLHAKFSAYQQEPNNICWYILQDGTAAAVTINKEQEIVAWHRHSIDGALIESIAVVPNEDASADNVYLVVNRSGSRFVELLNNDFYPNGTNKRGMRFLDGAVVFPELIVSGSPVGSFSGTVVGGLQHLEGKLVSIVIDGTLYGTATVGSGSVSVANQTNVELVVGISYASTAKSLPPEGGSAFGVSQGKIKKLAKYNVRLLNSLTLDYGFNANGQSLNALTNLHENGTSTNFYTGTKELIPNNPYDAESQWTLSTSKPYPLNILSVTLTVETGE